MKSLLALSAVAAVASANAVPHSTHGIGEIKIDSKCLEVGEPTSNGRYTVIAGDCTKAIDFTYDGKVISYLLCACALASAFLPTRCMGWVS